MKKFHTIFLCIVLATMAVVTSSIVREFFVDKDYEIMPCLYDGGDGVVTDGLTTKYFCNAATNTCEKRDVRATGTTSGGFDSETRCNNDCRTTPTEVTKYFCNTESGRCESRKVIAGSQDGFVDNATCSATCSKVVRYFCNDQKQCEAREVPFAERNNGYANAVACSENCQTVPTNTVYEMAVWVFCGQSNTDGRNEEDTKIGSCPAISENIKKWESVAWKTMTRAEDENVGPGLAFAHTLLDDAGLKTKYGYSKIGIIIEAKAASPMHEWKDKELTLYVGMKNTIEAALKNNSNAYLAGIVYVQGEQEGRGGITKQTYMDNLKQFVANVNADFTSYNRGKDNGKLPFVLTVMKVSGRTTKLPNIQVVRDAQKDVKIDGHLLYKADMEGSEVITGDEAHLSKEGACDLGRELAKAFIQKKIEL